MIEYFTNIAMLMSKYWKVFLITGVGNTLLLSVITVFFGAILGMILCLIRMSKLKILKTIAIAVVEVVRGTPMLLQLYVGYFIIPKILPFKVSEFMAVAIALCINSACYVSEVFRSGIQSVDKGQTEAARSLGLNSKQTMMKIVLPQAIKTILPSLGNEFIMIIKDTSLASTFYIGEIMTSFLIVKGNSFLQMECLMIVGAIYFVLTFVLSKILGAFERRFKAHD